MSVASSLLKAGLKAFKGKAPQAVRTSKPVKRTVKAKKQATLSKDFSDKSKMLGTGIRKDEGVISKAPLGKDTPEEFAELMSEISNLKVFIRKMKGKTDAKQLTEVNKAKDKLIGLQTRLSKAKNSASQLGIAESKLPASLQTQAE